MDAGFGMIVSKFGMGFFLPDFASDPVDLSLRRALRHDQVRYRDGFLERHKKNDVIQMCSSLHERSKCEGTSPPVLVVTLTPRVSSCRGSDRRDKMTLRYRSEYDPDFTPTHMNCDISFEYPCNAV